MERYIDYEVFRDKLRTLIDNGGDNIRSFSEKIGVSSATISRYLSITREPDLLYVINIAKKCHVSMEWLLGLTDNMNQQWDDDTTDMLNKYAVASEADKTVIRAILSKYGK